MDVAKVVEIALAGSNAGRVEVAALEPASVGMEAVGGLSQLISELVDNALAFSDPDRTVRLTGLHDQEDYLVSISDRGVGIPEHLMAELNRVLADPDADIGAEPSLGIALVARLSSRHGIAVRLVPGAPGTTARVTIPAALVGEPEPDSPSAPPARLEGRYPVGSGVVAMSEEARREAEAFLESVFAPLMAGSPEQPASNGESPHDPGDTMPASSPPEQRATVTELRVRVPGENFSVVEDDRSTMAAEGAIDIRSALSSYEKGRRSAADHEQT